MTTLQEASYTITETQRLEAMDALYLPSMKTEAMLRQKDKAYVMLQSLTPALAQHGDQKPSAYLTIADTGDMVWPPEAYDEACTYCDDDENPVPLYKAAPAPQPAQDVPETNCGNIKRELTDDEILSIAHRKATRYTHAVASGQVTYGFSVLHLLDFARAIEAAIREVK